ncbi:MAG: lysylphosphatidylglycerol synthase transmembrane domain-containing protein [Candidatus Omnitrophota bacterium]|nr:lysylphosphatidylglycerol synthase transmembrane domain-containing protein [Candidatus Omnitrophota bacterium]
MQKKIISIFIRASVSILLVVILLYIMRGKYAQILDAIKNADIRLVTSGLAVFILATIIASYRFKLIVATQKKTRLTFPEALSLTFIGYFFNNFLPTSIGGDVAKAYYLSRKKSEKLGSFTSVFVDRAIGLFTMIFMAAIALSFFRSEIIDRNVKIGVYSIALCALAIVILITNRNLAKRFAGAISLIKPIGEKAKQAYDAIHTYKNHTALIVKALFISVVSQLLFFASIGILVFSIGARIAPMEVFLRLPIISAISLLPSINGLGVREGSTVMLFGPLIGKTNAFAISILWLLILFIVSIIGGLIYALSPQFKIKWSASV